MGNICGPGGDVLRAREDAALDDPPRRSTKRSKRSTEKSTTLENASDDDSPLAFWGKAARAPPKSNLFADMLGLDEKMLEVESSEREKREREKRLQERESDWLDSGEVEFGFGGGTKKTSSSGSSSESSSSDSESSSSSESSDDELEIVEDNLCTVRPKETDGFPVADDVSHVQAVTKKRGSALQAIICEEAGASGEGKTKRSSTRADRKSSRKGTYVSMVQNVVQNVQYNVTTNTQVNNADKPKGEDTVKAQTAAPSKEKPIPNLPTYTPEKATVATKVMVGELDLTGKKTFSTSYSPAKMENPKLRQSGYFNYQGVFKDVAPSAMRAAILRFREANHMKDIDTVKNGKTLLMKAMVDGEIDVAKYILLTSSDVAGVRTASGGWKTFTVFA